MRCTFRRMRLASRDHLGTCPLLLPTVHHALFSLFADSGLISDFSHSSISDVAVRLILLGDKRLTMLGRISSSFGGRIGASRLGFLALLRSNTLAYITLPRTGPQKINASALTIVVKNCFRLLYPGGRTPSRRY